MADSRDDLLAVSGAITKAIRDEAVAIAAGYIYGDMQGPSDDKTNPFATGSFTEHLKGTGSDYLFLTHRPITAIASITDEEGISYDYVTGIFGTAKKDVDVWILDSIEHGIFNGVLMLEDAKWNPDYHYIVTYTAGFDTDSYVPQNLKTAILLIANDLVARQDNPNLQQVSGLHVSYTFMDSMQMWIPKEAAALLNGFRRWRA
jgi:hypothetical protein